MIEVARSSRNECADRPAGPVRHPNLHVFPTFAVGGTEVRMTSVINHLGQRYRHAIVALDGNYACRNRLNAGSVVDFPQIEAGRGGLLRNLLGIRSTLRRLRPRLLMTYNWGAIEWALANTLWPICRHVHLEDGFGLEEADHQLPRRVLFRRLALARASRVIVPSQNLAEIATQRWRLASRKVLQIPNGVDCKRFANASGGQKVTGLARSPDEVIVGTVAPLRPEKNLGLLLHAFAAVAGRYNTRLLIVGEGAERSKLSALAARLHIADRVVFTGQVEAVEDALSMFDAFALTSKTEQMPISVLEAMAAGKPVVAVDVGDVKGMLAPENRAFVASRDDTHEFAHLLERLIADKEMRTHLGSQNQVRVRTHYPEELMLEAYEAIFEQGQIM